jgi:hypothetical protein
MNRSLHSFRFPCPTCGSTVASSYGPGEWETCTSCGHYCQIPSPRRRFEQLRRSVVFFRYAGWALGIGIPIGSIYFISKGSPLVVVGACIASVLLGQSLLAVSKRRSVISRAERKP